VVGEGRGAELAEPAEEGRGRSLDRDAPEVGRVEVPGEMIAGEVELLLDGRDAPVSSQWAHGREHTQLVADWGDLPSEASPSIPLHKWRGRARVGEICLNSSGLTLRTTCPAGSSGPEKPSLSPCGEG